MAEDPHAGRIGLPRGGLAHQGHAAVAQRQAMERQLVAANQPPAKQRPQQGGRQRPGVHVGYLPAQIGGGEAVGQPGEEAQAGVVGQIIGRAARPMARQRRRQPVDRRHARDRQPGQLGVEKRPQQQEDAAVAGGVAFFGWRVAGGGWRCLLYTSRCV